MDEGNHEDRRRSYSRRQPGEEWKPQRQREKRYDGKHRQEIGRGIQPRQHSGLIPIREVERAISFHRRLRRDSASHATAVSAVIFVSTESPARSARATNAAMAGWNTEVQRAPR